MRNASLVFNFSRSAIVSRSARETDTARHFFPQMSQSEDTGKILDQLLVGGAARVHLIGVAGSGMSGIAGLLLALGHRVSGSDKVSTVEVERLQKLGLKFSYPHTAEAVRD